jgi:hypothetical protein
MLWSIIFTAPKYGTYERGTNRRSDQPAAFLFSTSVTEPRYRFAETMHQLSEVTQ